jgi:methyl-accepting chemotaxis protein
MKLNNIKIGLRLALGFGMLLALLVLVTATGLNNMKALNDTVADIVDRNNVRLQAANDMREAQRSYEANLSVIEASKTLLTRTIEILRG